MKKTLEAGIKEAKYQMNHFLEVDKNNDMLWNYSCIENILQTMLSAIDEPETEKPEAQGGVVDYEEIEKCWEGWGHGSGFGDSINKTKAIKLLKENQSQWLKTTPQETRILRTNIMS